MFTMERRCASALGIILKIYSVHFFRILLFCFRAPILSKSVGSSCLVCATPPFRLCQSFFFFFFFFFFLNFTDVRHGLKLSMCFRYNSVFLCFCLLFFFCLFFCLFFFFLIFFFNLVIYRDPILSKYICSGESYVRNSSHTFMTILFNLCNFFFFIV